MLPLIGIIYSGIIGSVTEVIAYRFNLVQSMTAWTQGSFSMIQTHQYEWLFLGLIILITVWKLSQTFTIMNLGKETSESLGISYSLLEKTGPLSGGANDKRHHDYRGWPTISRSYRSQSCSQVLWR